MKSLHYFLALLFFLCLLDLPYGYYQFVRWAGMAGFALLAYHYYELGHKKIALVLVAAALLFQLFAKVALGRAGWNVVDVVAGVGLVWLASSVHLKVNKY